MKCGNVNPLTGDTLCRRPLGHGRWHKGKTKGRPTVLVWCTAAGLHTTRYATVTAKALR